MATNSDMSAAEYMRQMNKMERERQLQMAMQKFDPYMAAQQYPQHYANQEAQKAAEPAPRPALNPAYQNPKLLLTRKA